LRNNKKEDIMKIKYKTPEKFTEIMELQKELDKSEENKNLKNMVYLKMKIVEKIVNFYNLKNGTKSDKIIKMTEIVISLAQFLNYLYDNNLQKNIVLDNKMKAFFSEYRRQVTLDDVDYILYDFSRNRYNVHSSNSELVLALIESIADFNLKLRNVLEILCNFGGLYEIEMTDIYEKYYEFWRNEMESEDENK
jgi:hypothetical protein